MVVLEELVIKKIIEGSSSTLVTEDDQIIRIENNKLDPDFKGGRVQVAVEYYGEDNPRYLAFFQGGRIVYPL